MFQRSCNIELPGVNSYFLVLHFEKHVYTDNKTLLFAVNAIKKKKSIFVSLVGLGVFWVAFFGWLVFNNVQ